MKLLKPKFRLMDEENALKASIFAGFGEFDEIIVNFLRQPVVMHIPNNLMSGFPGIRDNSFCIDLDQLAS